MLNVHLSPVVPNASEFDPLSFKELCRQAKDNVVKFIVKRELKGDTLGNWKKFLAEIEDNAKSTGSPINLSGAWHAGPDQVASLGEIPLNSLSLVELTTKNPKQMYRLLVSKLGQHDSVSTINGLFEKLSSYSVSTPNIIIYDRFLLRIEDEIITNKKDPDNLKPNTHETSLRKLALICKALSPLDSPNRITIVTEFFDSSRLQKKKKWEYHGPEIKDFFSSTKYTARVGNIIRSTVTSLRKLFPELNETEFIIYDCSDPSLGEDSMEHDRFIQFASEASLISSAGFSFRLPGRADDCGVWNDLAELPVNLSCQGVLNSTELPNSTYIVPVTGGITLPRRAHKITIPDV